MARRKHKTGRQGISKAQAYTVGIFTIPYDLEGIVGAIGAERTIELVKLIEAQTIKTKRNKVLTKVIKSKGEEALRQQISETVQRSLDRLHATKKQSKQLKKAA